MIGTVLGTLVVAPAAAVLVQVLAGAVARLRGHPRGVRRARLLVLIPAHDEGGAIAGTIVAVRGVLDQDGVAARMVVVADNCSDDTATQARQAGAEVLERQDPQRRGKGFALAWAIDQLRCQDDWDAVLVLDADARPLAGMAADVSAAIADGAAAVQANYGIDPGTDADGRGALMRLAFALCNGARPLGRHVLGGSSPITGNGFALSRRCLELVPWRPSGALAEDLEHGFALAVAGIRVRPLPTARVLAAPPPVGAGAASQRTRWEAGRAQAVRRWLGTLLRQPRWCAWETALDALIPPMAVLLLAQLAAIVGGWVGGSPLLTAAGAIGLAMLALAVVIAGPVAGLPWRSLVALRHVPAFVAWKLLLYGSPGFWRQRAWVRTARQATGLGVAILLLAACSRPAPEPPPDLPVARLPRTFPTAQEPDPAAFPRSCRQRFARLQPGDVVQVRIQADPRFREGVACTIDPLGRAPVPMAGPVNAEGLLPEELAQRVDAALAPWFTSPGCEVRMERPVERQALVTGAVVRQGPVGLRPDDSLLHVIARAEGLRETPSVLKGAPLLPREARIIRDRDSVAIVDLAGMAQDARPLVALAIAPGDLIQVASPTLRTVLVIGQVSRPGPVTLEDGMDVMQLVAVAGGASEDGDVTRAALVRGWWRPDGAEVFGVQLGQAVFKGQLLPVPQDRDIIVVPKRGLAEFGYILRQLTPGLLTFSMLRSAP